MALGPPLEPAVLAPRGDFDPLLFRQQLALRGMAMLWQEAFDCPCARPVSSVTTNMTSFSLGEYVVTGNARTACPLCKGAGYFLGPGTEIKGVMQDARNNNQRTAPQGEYSSGTVRVTLYPETKPSLGDRLTVRNSVMVIREARRRSSDVTEALRFPIASQTLKLEAGPQTVQTLRVQKANEHNITSAGDELRPGVDFDVTVAGLIDWTKGIANGHAPAENEMYTVSYYAHPRYVIFDFGHGVRDTWDGMGHPEHSPEFAPMPLLVYAKMEYLGAMGSRA